MDFDQTRTPPVFKAIPQKRMFEEIAEQIKKSILAGDFKPGDKLPSERELAIQFQTGRISVREALRTLEQAGLIFIKQGSEGGSFVKDIDISHVSDSLSDFMHRANIHMEDIEEIRYVVENLVIEKAIQRHSHKFIKEIEKNIQESEAILNESSENKDSSIDYELLEALNTDFHLILARATMNPFLELIMESLLKYMHPLTFSPARMRKHVDLHKGIYKALVDKDLQAATEIHRELREYFLKFAAENQKKSSPKKIRKKKE